MSLIAQLDDLKTACDRMTQSASRQQEIYFALIDGMVKLHQQHRVAKDYKVSDELRGLLVSVGVQIQQGTSGYDYESIPASLKGEPVDDTWTID